MQDDDSDLEHELEAFPTVSGEASMEAAACVKVRNILHTLKKLLLDNAFTVACFY